MPLLPPLQYDGISCFSRNILRPSRQTCLFVKRFDTRPVNTALASVRSNDSARELFILQTGMNKGDSLLFRMTGIELMHHVIEMRDPRAKMLPPPTWWTPASFKSWIKAAAPMRFEKIARDVRTDLWYSR
jgi:hypothetical protein